MRNIYYLSLVSLSLCVIFSCKKGEVIGGKSNADLIAGKWLVYQQHTRVYDLQTAELLKDTTLIISNKNPLALYEIYNTDGTSYVTTMPYKKVGATVLSTDTTAYLHYTIVGSSLILKQNNGGTETKPILNLSNTDMELEKLYTSTPLTGWGLDVNTTYKYIDDVSYTKQ